MRSILAAMMLTSWVTAPVQAAEDWPPKGTLMVDAIAAIANTDLITLYEFQRAAAPYLAKLRSESAGQDAASVNQKVRAIGDEVIESLINDRLVIQEAEKLDIKVSKADVDLQLAQVKKSNNWDDDELTSAVARLGFNSLVAYRRHVRKEILKNRAIGMKVSSKIRVDADEAKRVFAQTYGASQGVEERRVAHILLRLAELAPKPDVDLALAKLQGVAEAIRGGDITFEEAARQHSQDTTARAGGDVGWISRGDTDPDFESVAFSLTGKAISGPFKTSFGVHIVTITGSRRSTQLSDDKKASLMRQIRYRLREKELKHHYTAWLKVLRKDAFIEVKPILSQALPLQ